MDGIMDTLGGCVVYTLSLVLTAILMLGFVIIVIQCFIYLLPVLAVVVPSLIVVVALCKAIGNWLSP